MTGGERRFARRLEVLLGDECLCWYDVSIGAKRRRPDFLVLHPERGLLALEVKSWKIDSVSAADPSLFELNLDGQTVKEPNPLLKARDFITVAIDLLKGDPTLRHPPDSRYAGHLRFPYGHGVVLTNITSKAFQSCGMADVVPPHLTICQDQMTEWISPEAFQQRLWDMFPQPFPCQLTKAQVDRVRWHLYPEIRIPESSMGRQGNLFETDEKDPVPTAPDLIRVMDLQQEQLARSLGEGHRVIHGVAGSGKTMILGYRAEYLAQASSKPVLVLCFNRPLAQKIAAWMHHKGLSGKVLVRTMHGWCRDLVDAHQLSHPDPGEQYFQELVQAVTAGVALGQVPTGQYDAVLIDEGHDFEPEWFQLIVQMVDPATNALLVTYDGAQAIYMRGRKRRFSFASVGIHAQGRSTILKLNYRNTAEILDAAYAFARELLDARDIGIDSETIVAPQSAGRRGPRPEFFQVASFRDEVFCIADKLRACNREGTPFRDMAVLVYRKAQADDVMALLGHAGIPAQIGFAAPNDHNANRVSIFTLHSSKGLEFAVVAIPGLGEMPYASHDAQEQARVLYVGMTRATHRLILTAHRKSDFAVKASEACEKAAQLL
ncbi:MAG: ATP-binding domain-containing protein [Rhodospirillales bacterium]|nr:ATP-binding domain-containing protein [Rhodospirillales bacterium]